MQASGSGAQAPTALLTVPVTGFYTFEADFTVGAVTGTGSLSVVVTVPGGTALASARNATAKGGYLAFLPAGTAVTYEIEKPGGISNSPDWTLTLRVRNVGGPDLLQETP